MSRHELEVSADYRQIWLEDKQNRDDNPKFIFTAKHFADRVWVYPHMIIMFTARNSTVPVTLETNSTEPEDRDFAEWDHVVEASIEVISGSLTISGLNDMFELIYYGYPNSIYRVRMCHANLGSIRDDGLEGDDYYKIIVWPDTYIEPTVLKRWVEPK
jgi:hypothetical protein